MDQANLLRISTFTYIYRIPYTIISCLTLGETSHLGGYCASLLWLPLVGWKIVARTNQTENVSSWCVIRAGNQTHFHVSLSICSTAPESSWNLKNLIFSSQSSFLKKAISQLKLFKCYSIYLHRGHWLSIEGREKVVSGYLHLWSSMIGWFNVQHISGGGTKRHRVISFLRKCLLASKSEWFLPGVHHWQRHLSGCLEYGHWSNGYLSTKGSVHSDFRSTCRFPVLSSKTLVPRPRSTISL